MDEEAQKKLKAMYRQCFSTEAGQEVLKDMVVRAGIYRVRKDHEPADIWFHEGEKSMVLFVLSQMQIKEEVATVSKGVHGDSPFSHEDFGDV